MWKVRCCEPDEPCRKLTLMAGTGKFQGVERMVTSRIILEDTVDKGFKELITRKDDHIKILVTPKQQNLTKS